MPEELDRAIREALSGLDAEVAVAVARNVESAKETSGAGGLDNVGKILAVSSAKGGVGKSNIALNLAVSLARHRQRVVLFDDDAYKVLDGERASHVLVPPWRMDVAGDTVLRELARSVEAHLDPRARDVAEAVPAIASDLAACEARRELRAGGDEGASERKTTREASPAADILDLVDELAGVAIASPSPSR